MRISVKVTPQAKENRVVEDITNSQTNKPSERHLKVKIAQAPQDGKANEKLLEILAHHFQVKPRNIKIISGLTSRNKIVEIE